MENGAQTGLLQLALGAGVSAGFHPLTYAKVLIQIGHEPLAPVATTSIFGRPVLAYPNVFKYMGHIRKRDGFLGLYRGLGYRIASGVLGSTVSNKVGQFLREQDEARNEEIDDDEEDSESFKKVLKQTTNEMVARCAGLIVSQPTHVIMVRCMAQFVGEETVYSGLFSSISEIYHKEGLLGFFAGLAPRLLGEALTIWATNLLVHVINTYLVPKGQETKFLKQYTSTICTLLVTQLTYPFSLVSNVMVVCDSGLAAGSFPNMPTYENWRQCLSALRSEGQLKRGSSLFFRYYKGPVTYMTQGGKPLRRNPFS